MFNKTFTAINLTAQQSGYFAFQPTDIAMNPTVFVDRQYAIAFTDAKGADLGTHAGQAVRINGVAYMLFPLSGKVSNALFKTKVSEFQFYDTLNDGMEPISRGKVTIVSGPPTLVDDDTAPYARFIDLIVYSDDPSNGNPPTFEVTKIRYDPATITPMNGATIPAPVSNSAPTLLGSAQVGSTLTVTNGSWTNNPSSYAYRWYAGGTLIAVATGSTYSPVSADVGKTIYVTVLATNAGGTGSANTATTAVVTAAPVTAPANTVAPAITGTAQEGQTLTVSTGTWSGSPTGYTRQWKANNVNISGATGTTYLLTASEVGKTITSTITATNSGGSASATSAATATVSAASVAAPVNTVLPTISGTAQVGQVLTVSNGSWTNSPTGYSYVWRAAGTVISGATASTYTPVSGDVGKTITATVTATNSGGSNSASSAATSAVTAAAVAAPTNSAVPTISGTAQAGQVLTATTGTWSGSPTYAYQWQRGTANISGATASTYTVVAGDVGSTLKVIVTATNAGGSVSANSASTATVIAAPTTSTERSFSYNEYQPGWTLVREETSDPNVLRINNNNGFESASHYMSIMTGTDARASLYHYFKTSIADRKSGLYFEVSVDGGDYVRTNYNDATDDFQLFSGLADVPHLVAVRTPAALYETVYVKKAESPLKITGSAPSLKLVDQWLQPGQPNASVHVGNGLDGFVTGPNNEMLVGGSLVNNPNAVVTPRKVTDYRSGGTPSMSFRANVSELWFVTGQRMVHVWDGTQMFVVDTGKDAVGGQGGNNIRVKRLTGLSGLKTYYVWTSSNGLATYFSVGLVGGTAQPLTEGNRSLDQFGDSITQGVTSTAPNTKPENDRGYIDTYRVAAKLGFTGCAIGVGGYGVAELNRDLPGWIERKTVTSADVALIAIGQNGGVPDASVYNSIIDKLLAKGYGKVICRGVIPVSGGGWAAINTTIEGIVSGRADPRVKYMNVNSWTTITKPDGIHPNVPGYDQMVDLSVAALPTLLA